MQADHTSELRACFKRSYDDVLKHHHGWFIQSAVYVRVGNALFQLRKQTLIFYFSPSCLVALSAGDHDCTVPIRVLQADIPGRISREVGRGIGKVAQGP